MDNEKNIATKPMLVAGFQGAAVLIGCEESQTICIEMRKQGIQAFSCDTQECSGGHPEWHLRMDIFKAIELRKWDMMIAHPPCTFISRAGARWLFGGGKINNERLKQGEEGRDFLLRLFKAPIRRIAIENPTPMKIFNLPKETQVIQPYQFGHEYSKRTLLWLKNLPNLIPTDIRNNYKPYLPSNTGGKKRGQKYQFKNITQKESSKTFEGIAKAMATQWGYLAVAP